MSDPTLSLVRSDEVTRVVASRDAAVDLYDHALTMLDEVYALLDHARSNLARACGGSVHSAFYSKGVDEVDKFHALIKRVDVQEMIQTSRGLVDVAVWAGLVENTSLSDYMDKKAKEELRKQLSYSPRKPTREDEIDVQWAGIPAVTEENVRATFDQFIGDAPTIWRRGIANAFAALDRRFRSHDGFKIGDRMVITNAFDAWGSWSYYHDHRATLDDVERVFLVMDKRDPADPEFEGISKRISRERGNQGLTPRQSVHEGDYFRVRVFKNGNAHLWFTRKDLVDRVNLALAEYYGAALGHGVECDPDPEAWFDRSRSLMIPRPEDHFPTPPDLVQRVMSEAGLNYQDGLLVLEPSAGDGDLAREAVRLGHTVDCVECSNARASALLASGLYWSVDCRDFLQVSPDGRYDVVVMNPPFGKGQSIDHVWHAMEFLRPGGKLVAIMPAGVEFSSTRRAVALRDRVKEHRGQWWDLPAGSFAPATNVNTTLLVVTL